MCATYDSASSGPDPATLILIVLGAHLHAEIAHRPLGYRLAQEIVLWQAKHPQAEPLDPVLCTDLWYLNAGALMERPTVSIGPPEVNAVSAYLGNRLPVVFVIEDRLQVQMDPELIGLHACIWGADDRSTAAGLDLFVERFLDQFLQAAHGIGAA